MSFKITKGGGGGNVYLIHLGDAKLGLPFEKLRELHRSIGIVIAHENKKRVGVCICTLCAACQYDYRCTRESDPACYDRCRECFEVAKGGGHGPSG